MASYFRFPVAVAATAMLLASESLGAQSASVSISSFAIRGDQPYVSVGRRVPLNATATGAPTQFRAAEVSASGTCARSLARALWEPLSARRPPTWSFSQTGLRKICFQLRRASDGQVSSIIEDDITVVPSGWQWQSSLLGTKNTPLGAPITFPLVHTLSCASTFAIGLEVRRGLWVDAIALRCANLGPRWEHSGAYTTEFRGGSGGNRSTIQCSSGQVLTAVEVRYGLYVDQIKIRCRTWPGAQVSGLLPEVPPFVANFGDKEAKAECPAPLAVRRLPEIYLRGSIVPFGSPGVAAFDVGCSVTPDV